MFDYPIRLFLSSLFGLWLAAQIGASAHRWRNLKEGQRDDFNVTQAGTLTLLSLIIGFSFSMAINRYEQRKSAEEGEANAIGTEYVRAGLLPAADTAAVRGLLKKYLDLRILFYRTREEDRLRQINADTAALQKSMWSAVEVSAKASASPVVALAISGMNDVLNAQGYAQASYWNHIPVAAWSLMIAIATCCNLLLGYGGRKAEAGTVLLLVMPLVVSISFLLIADIDSPRRGFISIAPENLINVGLSVDKDTTLLWPKTFIESGHSTHSSILLANR